MAENSLDNLTVSRITLGSGGPSILVGFGPPSASEAPGSIYLRKDAPSTALRVYMRDSDGWIPASPTVGLEPALGAGSYFVDPVAGDDRASGLAGHPWRSWRGGALRHLGARPFASSRVDVTILGDLPADDPFVVEPTIATSGGLYVHGARLPVAGGTGTLTGAVARSPATNGKVTITDALRATWTPMLERLIVITGGTPANVGAASFIHTDLGGGSCETGSFIKADSTSTFFGLAEVAPAIGDTYAIYDLPRVNGDAYVSGRGAKAFVAGRSALMCDNLYFTGASGAAFISENHGIVQAFAHCRFGDRAHSRSPEFSGAGQTFVINCMNDYGLKSRTAASDVSIYGGINGSSVVNGAGEVFQGGNIYVAMGHLLVKGHAILVQGPCQFVVGDIGIFDKGAPAINVSGNGYVLFRSAIGSKLWGSSTLAGFHALSIDPGTVAYQGDLASLVTLARNGVAHDFKLGGQASGPAMNPTGVSTADARDYTLLNLMATIAAGGFGGSCVDPISGNRLIVTPTS